MYHKIRCLRQAFGKEEGWYWDIDIHVCRNGTFHQKSALRFRKIKHEIERTLFSKAVRRGVCVICGEIDFRVLEDHHPFPDKDKNLKLTLCANCHARLHWMLGGNRRIHDKKNKTQG
jgi:hypothetical protein